MALVTDPELRGGIRPRPGGTPVGLSSRRIAEIQAKVAAGQMSVDDAVNELNATNIPPSPWEPAGKLPKSPISFKGSPVGVTLPAPAEKPMPEYVPPTPQPTPTPTLSQWEAQWANQRPDYDPEPGANLPLTFWESQPPGTQQRFFYAPRAEKAFFVKNGRFPTDTTELNRWLSPATSPVPVPVAPSKPLSKPTTQTGVSGPTTPNLSGLSPTLNGPPATAGPSAPMFSSPQPGQPSPISDPNTVLRDEIRKLLQGYTGQKNPYALTDPTLPLGRPALTGLETTLGTQAMGLKYDVDAERKARQALINQGIQTSEEQLARMFAISPSGVTGSGESMRGFEGLELGKARLLNELEAELSQRAPQETRANIEALLGLQQSREQAGLSERGLNLQQLAQAIGFTGQEEELAQRAGALTGTYQGAQTEEARRNRAQEALTVGAATGTMPLMNSDGTPAIDPATGRQRYGTTLDAQRLGLQTQELYGGTAPPVEFSRNDFIVAMGKKTGEAGYNPAFDVDKDGTITENDISIVGADAKDLGGGRYSYTPAGSRTLAARTQGAQVGIQEREQRLNEQRTYGGQWITDAAGAKKWQPTLESSQWSDTMKLNYDKLTEDTRQARVQERLQIADRTGLIDEPGKFSTGDFRVAMADSNAGKAFDPAFDFTGDGKVDHADFFKGQESGLLSDKSFSTLAAKKQEAEIANAATVLQLDKDKLTEATRQFNKNFGAQRQEFLTKTTGYVYDVDGDPVMKTVPDVSQGFTQLDAYNMDRAFGDTPERIIRITDPDYKASFDLNDDHQIDYDEFTEAIETAQYTSTKGLLAAKIISNPISTLEREQFQTDKDQWEKKFGQSIDEFLESMGFSRDKLAIETEAAKLAAWLGLIGNFAQGAATYGASRGRSGTTAGGYGGTAPTVTAGGGRVTDPTRP